MTSVSNISDTFHQARQENRTVLIPYITVGFPEATITPQLIIALANAGADIIELGVPFSDPTADGPVVQYAGQIALRNGITMQHCLEAASAARSASIPLILMGYMNPFLQYGLPQLTKQAQQAGIKGFIVPDLPPEEGIEFSTIAAENGCDLIYMAAPSSSSERLKLIGQRSRGFVYGVTVRGVTGERRELPSDVPQLLTRIRRYTQLPVAAGFGISTPKHVQLIGQYADGAVVGSALIHKLINTTGHDTLHAASTFTAALKTGTYRHQDMIPYTTVRTTGEEAWQR